MKVNLNTLGGGATALAGVGMMAYAKAKTMYLNWAPHSDLEMCQKMLKTTSPRGKELFNHCLNVVNKNNAGLMDMHYTHMVGMALFLSGVFIVAKPIASRAWEQCFGTPKKAE